MKKTLAPPLQAHNTTRIYRNRITCAKQLLFLSTIIIIQFGLITAKESENQTTIDQQNESENSTYTLIKNIIQSILMFYTFSIFIVPIIANIIIFIITIWIIIHIVRQV